MKREQEVSASGCGACWPFVCGLQKHQFLTTTGCVATRYELIYLEGAVPQRRQRSGVARRRLCSEHMPSGEVRAAGTQRMAAISAPARPTALPPLGSIKGVLFDIDGTLCDSDPLHYRAFREILLEKGYKVRARPACVRLSWRPRR